MYRRCLSWGSLALCAISWTPLPDPVGCSRQLRRSNCRPRFRSVSSSPLFLFLTQSPDPHHMCCFFTWWGMFATY